MAREIKFRAFVVNSNGNWMALQGNHPDIDTAGKFLSKYEEHIVMQFTGLKDRNGKEIYEGDIIRLGKNQKHYEVAWSEIIAGFIIKNGGPNYELAAYEVIGNIYETPELLEAK